MRIGIDCRMWNETGIGRYIRNIVRVLSEKDDSNEYVLFILPKDRKDIKLPSNFKLVETDIRWHTFKEQLVLPFFFYKENVDLMFIPNLNVPVLYFKDFVITIHDLTVTKIKTGRASTLPYFFYLIKRIGVKVALFYAIHFSKRIFTVSNYVKNEISVGYNISRNKIVLTPCAAEEHFIPVEKEKTTEILRKYNIKEPYLFCIGNAHPHKNIESLLKAFELITKEFPNLSLVLGGNKKFFYERLEKEWSTSSIFPKLNFIGFVDDADLPALYSGAVAYVNPSFHEGFGIQILEAFSCGTRVVCSNASSLPEVGGNIAYYFNPRDIKNMAQEITKCIQDTNEERIKAGLKRAEDFSWEESGNKVYKVIQSTKTN